MLRRTFFWLSSSRLPASLPQIPRFAGIKFAECGNVILDETSVYVDKGLLSDSFNYIAFNFIILSAIFFISANEFYAYEFYIVRQIFLTN